MEIPSGTSIGVKFVSSTNYGFSDLSAFNGGGAFISQDRQIGPDTAPNYNALSSDIDHGARGGGTLHSVATSTSDGFMSNTDKILLDEMAIVTLTYQPGGISGAGKVATWAEVDAFATSVDIPWVLFVDDTYGAPEVPSTADTDFGLLCAMRGGVGGHSSALIIKDGGKLRNISTVGTAFSIACEAITTPGIYLDITPGFALMQIKEGGVVANLAGISLVPAIEVSLPNSVIAVAFGSSLQHNEPTVPLINYTAIGGFQLIPHTQNTSGLPSPIPANCIQADPTTTMLYFKDNTSVVNSQSSFYAGSILVNNIDLSAELNWSNGATGSRPATPTTGQMYFDTDIGYAIWWNGAAWVDGTGTPA